MMLPCNCSNIVVLFWVAHVFVHVGLSDALQTVYTVRLLEVYAVQVSVSARLSTILTAWLSYHVLQFRSQLRACELWQHGFSRHWCSCGIWVDTLQQLDSRFMAASRIKQHTSLRQAGRHFADMPWLCWLLIGFLM